jgi:hypothetical protein
VNDREKKILAVGIILLIAAIYFLPGLPKRLCIEQQCFEGPNSQIYGVSIANGQIYTTNQQLPSPYFWGSVSGLDVILNQKGGFGYAGCQVEITVTNPQPSYPPAGTVPSSFSYWVNRTQQNISYMTHVTGQIKFYTFYVTVKAIDTGQLNQCVFSGPSIWIEIQSILWNQAYQATTLANGTVVYGQAWEAPIFLTVSKWQQYSNVGSCVGAFHDIYPNGQGADLTLYPAAGSGQPITQVNAQVIQNTNPLAPSSLLSQNAFYQIQLQNYGVENAALFDCGTLSNVAPTTFMTMQLTTIQLGEYTLTEPLGVQPPVLPPNASGSSDILTAFRRWLQSPLTIAGTFLLLIIVLLVAVIAVYYLVVRRVVR